MCFFNGRFDKKKFSKKNANLYRILFHDHNFGWRSSGARLQNIHMIFFFLTIFWSFLGRIMFFALLNFDENKLIFYWKVTRRKIILYESDTKLYYLVHH